jgi:hypothetical protein
MKITTKFCNDLYYKKMSIFFNFTTKILTKHIKDWKIIIVAPLGKSMRNEKYKPKIVEIMPKIIDKIVICAKVFAKSFAIAGGIIKKAEIKIMPTNLTEITIAIAKIIDKMLFSRFRFIPSEIANSLSKVM